MAVSRDDVRRMATLARIGLDESRIDALVGELNGILKHIDALQQADGQGTAAADAAAAAPMPLRPDEPDGAPLAREREDFAPQMRDGFFLVPRLASHDDAGGNA